MRTISDKGTLKTSGKASVLQWINIVDDDENRAGASSSVRGTATSIFTFDLQPFVY